MYTLLKICSRYMCLCIVYDAHTCVAFSYLDKYLPIVYIAKWFMSWAWITAQLNSSLCVKKKNILWCESLAFQHHHHPFLGEEWNFSWSMERCYRVCQHAYTQVYINTYLNMNSHFKNSSRYIPNIRMLVCTNF